jgi:hypothetical protein
MKLFEIYQGLLESKKQRPRLHTFKKKYQVEDGEKSLPRWHLVIGR